MPTEHFSCPEICLVITKAVGNVSDISFSKCNWLIPVSFFQLVFTTETLLILKSIPAMSFTEFISLLLSDLRYTYLKTLSVILWCFLARSSIETNYESDACILYQRLSGVCMTSTAFGFHSPCLIWPDSHM